MRHNMSIDTDPQQQEAAPPLVLVVRSSSRYVSLNVRVLLSATLVAFAGSALCAPNVASVAVNLDGSFRLGAVEHARVAEAVRRSANLCHSAVSQLRANVGLVVKESFPSTGIPPTAAVKLVLVSEGLGERMVQEGQVVDSAHSPGLVLIALSCS